MTNKTTAREELNSLLGDTSDYVIDSRKYCEECSDIIWHWHEDQVKKEKIEVLERIAGSIERMKTCPDTCRMDAMGKIQKEINKLTL